jgi:5'-3' exonuclease
MGVQDLMKLVRSKCPSILYSSAQEAVQGNMWVDTPLIVMAAIKKAEADGHDAASAVVSSLRRTHNVLRAMGQGEIFWVFDGSTRHEKTETVAVRQEANSKFAKQCSIKAMDRQLQQMQSEVESLETDLSIADYVVDIGIPKHSQVSSLFKLAKQTCLDLGIVCLAKHDSEEYIARNMKSKDLAVTSDSDALPFGCSWIVQHLGSSTETWIRLSDLLESLNLSMDRFRWLCVLLGNDFNARVFRCGPAKCIAAVSSESFSIDSFAAEVSAPAGWKEAAIKTFEVYSGPSVSTSGRVDIHVER